MDAGVVGNRISGESTFGFWCPYKHARRETLLPSEGMVPFIEPERVGKSGYFGCSKIQLCFVEENIWNSYGGSLAMGGPAGRLKARV